MISKYAIRLVAIAMVGFVAACDPDHVPHPVQPEDWSAYPEGCARLWDEQFPAAVAGNPKRAEFLYLAIARNNLVPPGRDPDNYAQRQKDFDLLALMRLSVNEYVLAGDDAPVSDRLRRIGRMRNIVYFNPATHDPRGIQENALRWLGDYVGYVWPDFRSKEGICEKRTGLSHETEEWSAACRQILADDRVLPSTEDFVATFPENTHACGYKG